MGNAFFGRRRHTPAFAVSDSSNNTDFIVDASGNVGIGTTAPAEILDITGGNIQISTGGVQRSLKFENGVTLQTEIGVTAANKLFIANKQDANIGFEVNGTEKVTIQSGGNVGIGTTAPIHNLHIVQTSTSGASLLATRDLASGSTDNVIARFHQNNAGDDQAVMQIRQDGTGNIFEVSEDDNTPDIFVIQSGGNVGIGTTAPQRPIKYRRRR